MRARDSRRRLGRLASSNTDISVKLRQTFIHNVSLFLKKAETNGGKVERHHSHATSIQRKLLHARARLIIPRSVILQTCAKIRTSRWSRSSEMLSSALSVSNEQPDRMKVWILGAWLTIPSIASSVILHWDKSITRRLSAECRRISGGSCSSHVVGL